VPAWANAGAFIYSTASIGQAKTAVFTGLSKIKAGADVTEECHTIKML
jgi:hypothetical protein